MDHAAAVVAAQRALDAAGAGLRVSSDPRRAWTDGSRYLVGFDGGIFGPTGMIVEQDGRADLYGHPSFEPLPGVWQAIGEEGGDPMQEARRPQ